MAKKKKGVAPVETVDAKDVSTAFPTEQPAEQVLVMRTAPQPTEEEIAETVKAEQRQALEQEVVEIAGDRDPAYVVWSVETTDGRTTGTSLKYYMDCKMHEIETGTPCHFERLIGQPAQALPGALKLVASKVAKKCPTCK